MQRLYSYAYLAAAAAISVSLCVRGGGREESVDRSIETTDSEEAWDVGVGFRNVRLCQIRLEISLKLH